MKLHKLSVLYRSAKILLALAVFIVSLITIFVSGRVVPAAAGPFLFLLGVGIIVGGEYLYWKRFSYKLTENKLQLWSGVLRRRHRDIPLHRIQNVDIRRNIVQRVLGLAEVRFETAGGTTTEATLRYVSPDEAKRMQIRVKDVPQRTTREQRGQRSPQTADTVLFELEPRELAVLGISTFNPRTIGFFALLYMLFGAQIWADFSIELTLLLFLALPLIIISVIGAGVRKAELFYGFILTRTADVLEYERGLFNRADGSIPLDKVQTLRIEDNPLKRLLGYATLKVETAGYSRRQNGNMETETEVAIPIAKRGHVEDLAHKLEPIHDFTVQPVTSRARWRYITRYMLAAVCIVISAYIAHQLVSTVPYQWGVILLPVAVIAGYLKWKHRGYGVGQRCMYTRNGFWFRQTRVTPYYRVQNLMRTEGLLQRRWNLSTVILDTAGTSRFGSNAKAVDIDTEQAEQLQYTVFDNFIHSIDQKPVP